jgi:hypothetical protein
MVKLEINDKHCHFRVPRELLEALQATGAPNTYAREVLMEHFKLDVETIKATRRQEVIESLQQQQEAN